MRQASLVPKTPYVTLLPPLECSLSNYCDYNQWKRLFGHHRPPLDDQSSPHLSEKNLQNLANLPFLLGFIAIHSPRRFMDLWSIQILSKMEKWGRNVPFGSLKTCIALSVGQISNHIVANPIKKIYSNPYWFKGKQTRVIKTTKKNFFLEKFQNFFFWKKNFIINVKFCIRTYVMKTRKLSKSTSKKT